MGLAGHRVGFDGPAVVAAGRAQQEPSGEHGTGHMPEVHRRTVVLVAWPARPGNDAGA